MRKKREVEKTRGLEFMIQSGNLVVVPVAIAVGVWRYWGGVRR